MELSTWIIIIILITLIFTGTVRINPIQEGFQNPEHHKIAFCFLTMGDVHKYQVWETFFKDKENLYNIYVHPKRPEQVKSFFKNHIIPTQDQVPTKWGDISLVRATLQLFKNALQDPSNKMFVLVSDSCIPIYSFDYIYNELISNQTNIIPSHSQQNSYTMFRYKQLKDPNFLTKNKFKKVSQWSAFNQETAHFLVKNDYTYIYQKMFCPDEHYFANILDKFNIAYDDRRLTRDDWDNASLDPKYRPYPKTYTEISPVDLQKARRTGALFFRKVVPETNVRYSDLFVNTNYDVSIISR